LYLERSSIGGCPLEEASEQERIPSIIGSIVWCCPTSRVCKINVDEDDDPRKVNIAETEGQRDLEGPGVELPFIGQRIKIKKVNIGTEHALKLANVGDYWDVATIDKITELLHEYQDLFPTKFTDMKGIKGPMGDMRIPLNPDEIQSNRDPTD
jgi:hypothetical protein